MNENLDCQKTHPQYLSRLKWFKTRYTNYSKLMLFNSSASLVDVDISSNDLQGPRFFVVARFENIHPTWVIGEYRDGMAKGADSFRKAIYNFNKSLLKYLKVMNL